MQIANEYKMYLFLFASLLRIKGSFRLIQKPPQWLEAELLIPRWQQTEMVGEFLGVLFWT